MNLAAKCFLSLIVVVLIAGCEQKVDQTAINNFGGKLERSLETPVRVSCKDGWMREVPLRSILLQQLDAPLKPTPECEANLRPEGVAMIGPDHNIPFFLFSAQIGPRKDPAQQRTVAIGVLLDFAEAVPYAKGCKVAKLVSELDASKIDVSTLKKPVFEGTK